ncbi:MAG: four helix bundle protein [Candidatus Korobacteraceae bacterium]
MQANRYQDLIAWQKAIAFVKRVYAITANFPQEETFGPKSQMRRCVVSVPSNIAEGQGRGTPGEFQQFLGHARGSLYELETQIVIASELGYFSVDERRTSLAEAGQLGRILNALKASLKPVARVSTAAQLTTDN